ncbi:peptidase U32 family protein [Acetobacterium woodii]|uniref:Peptidase U32 n=1 Tax=Acetobacterium woodii (strain ATCC 29683 / DSM 1030 / JCM 2381 / KCTC 1655 / WB1) TaxID=931626 RepID=H6LCJ8_ACEWD|nr:U32 family peptidase [Acetobacterium woodii]AFA47780.1 peptidase U32 [Acetobacterium woodii DSM 1030]
MKKPELLAPAGNFEKLKYALHYGADAVYCAGERFGLRAKADNFSQETLSEAVAYVHERNKKIYVTLNIIAHNADLEGLPEYVEELQELGIDGVIVADPGVFSVVREVAPELKISVSTQANNTNWRSVAFWHAQGAKRIVLARELGLKEIQEIREKVAPEMEIETFVHGAMCISYSGRCLLSHYMTGRNSNQGDCAHPCRWKYHLIEETRPDEAFSIEEDETGSFIFNSKDLCLINEIPQLMIAGVNSFKIEGRMKSLYYVATVVSAYRSAIDYCCANPTVTHLEDGYYEELTKVSHRNYTKGFFNGKTTAADQNYGTSSYTRNYDFVGLVLAYDEQTRMALIEQRNKVSIGDEIEIMIPGKGFFKQKIEAMTDQSGKAIESTPHPKMQYYLLMKEPVKPMDLLRKKD